MAGAGESVGLRQRSRADRSAMGSGCDGTVRRNAHRCDGVLAKLAEMRAMLPGE
jgi:hypothetical protein